MCGPVYKQPPCCYVWSRIQAVYMLLCVVPYSGSRHAVMCGPVYKQPPCCYVWSRIQAAVMLLCVVLYTSSLHAVMCGPVYRQPPCCYVWSRIQAAVMLFGQEIVSLHPLQFQESLNYGIVPLRVRK